jgi:hypothetical protein
LHHAHIEMIATAKAPMLMKPAMSGGEAPPEKNAPGCWGEGEGMKVVVVVVGSAGFTSVGAVGAKVRSPVLSSGNRLEGAKKVDDMAGGREDG